MLSGDMYAYDLTTLPFHHAGARNFVQLNHFELERDKRTVLEGIDNFI